NAAPAVSPTRGRRNVMTARRTSLTIALCAAALLAARAAAADQPVKVGDKVENLTFKDTHYLPRSLDDFKEKKAFVVAFTTADCPVVQRYLPTLQKLEKEYRDKGVQFLAVNVGPDDPILKVAAQQVEHGMEFPFVKDFDHSCVKVVGAK